MSISLSFLLLDGNNLPLDPRQTQGRGVGVQHCYWEWSLGQSTGTTGASNPRPGRPLLGRVTSTFEAGDKGLGESQSPGPWNWPQKMAEPLQCHISCAKLPPRPMGTREWGRRGAGGPEPWRVRPGDSSERWPMPQMSKS